MGVRRIFRAVTAFLLLSAEVIVAQANNSTAQAYRIGNMPDTFLIDREGGSPPLTSAWSTGTIFSGC